MTPPTVRPQLLSSPYTVPGYRRYGQPRHHPVSGGAWRAPADGWVATTIATVPGDRGGMSAAWPASSYLQQLRNCFLIIVLRAEAERKGLWSAPASPCKVRTLGLHRDGLRWAEGSWSLFALRGASSTFTSSRAREEAVRTVL